MEAGAALVGRIERARTTSSASPSCRYRAARQKLISPADTYIYEHDWAPGGKGFAATGAKGNGDNNWWIATLDTIDAQTGALRVIAAPQMQMNLPRVSPGRKEPSAFIGGLMSDWGPIGGDVYIAPLAGGAPADVTTGYKGTFRGLAWHGKTLMTQALIDDRNAVVSLDPVSHATRVLWSAPVSVKAQNFDGAIPVSADGAVAATILEDFTHAPEIAMGRLPNLAPITKDNRRACRQRVGAKRALEQRGVSRAGLADRAEGGGAGGKKYPMVVIVHGGPSSAVTPRYIVAGGQHGIGFDFAYDLIAKGAYIFEPNDRGSYGQGEAFTRANIKDFGRGDLRDMLAGVDAVEKTAPVDDAKLGLYGHSYGGWMAMWVNTQTHRFKAIVAGAGIANWTSYYGQNGIDRWMVPFFGASVYDDPAVYRAASPIEFIKNAKTPTLVYVGERDVECPAPQSLEYWHALKEIGTTSELYIYAGEGHRFRKLTDLEDLRGRILGWYATYLK